MKNSKKIMTTFTICAMASNILLGTLVNAETVTSAELQSKQVKQAIKEKRQEVKEDIKEKRQEVKEVIKEKRQEVKEDTKEARQDIKDLKEDFKAAKANEFVYGKGNNIELKKEKLEEKSERVNEFVYNKGQRQALLQELKQRREQLKQLQQATNEVKKQLKQRELAERLYIRGKLVKFDVKPYISEGRTLVPVAVVANSLQAKVTWDAPNKKVIIEKDGKIIELTINSKIVLVDGKEVTIEVPATIKNGRTFVPIRFISSVFNEKVDYNEETGDIDIGMDIEDTDATTGEPINDTVNQAVYGN